MKDPVLLLIKGLGRGGAEQLLVNAAKHLDRDRFRYEAAYVLPHKSDLAPELEAFGIPVHCLGGAFSTWIVSLRRLVRQNGYRLVHSHLPQAGIGARIGLRRRTRLVYTEHNEWDCYRPSTRRANMLTIAAEDHVFAVSQHVKDSIRPPRMFGVPRHRPPVEVLYHGIDLDSVDGWRRTEGVREELGIPRSAFVVGTVANFRAEKGYDHLIAAAATARRSLPDIRFVLVGQGPTEAATRDQVRRFGLEDTVTFAGYRTDAPRVCGSFDVFALSSLHEGLSIALIEAMAMGKPAVVTSAGGLVEVVRDGVDGYVVPIGDADAIAKRLVQLGTDPDLRATLSEQARLRSATFDIRTAVRRMESVYEELLA